MKKNITAYLLSVCFILSCGLISCKKDNGTSHDSSAPVIVNKFYPTTGGVGTEILITGKNFTTDTSQISVTIGGQPVKVIGSDGTGIMVVVPQKCKSGLVEIKVANSKVVTSVEEFTYMYSATVTTLAGNNKAAGFADGEGGDAKFYFYDPANPWRKGSICVDTNLNVYVGDAANFCLRKITPDGTVTTLAGRAGSDGDVGGQGSAARFRAFYGMDCDAQGNIFIVDVSSWNIRKVTPAGYVTTVGSTSFEPWCLGIDKRDGTLYITNPNADAAGGIYQRKPDGTMTHIIKNIAVGDVVVDKDGNLYATEFGSNVISKFDAGTWKRTVIAGSGNFGYADGPFASAKVANPWGIVIDNKAGDLYIAGNGVYDGGAGNPDQSIRRVDMAASLVRTVAGSGSAGFADANGSNAMFFGPLDIAIDKNNVLYVYDKRNNAIRKIVYE